MQHKLYELFVADQRVRGLCCGLDAATRRSDAQQAALGPAQAAAHSNWGSSTNNFRYRPPAFEHQSRDSQSASSTSASR